MSERAEAMLEHLELPISQAVEGTVKLSIYCAT